MHSRSLLTTRQVSFHLATGLFAAVALLSVRSGFAYAWLLYAALGCVFCGMVISSRATGHQAQLRCERFAEIASCGVAGWGFIMLLTIGTQFGKIMLLSVYMLSALIVIQSFTLYTRRRHFIIHLLAAVLLLCGFVLGWDHLMRQFLYLVLALYLYLVIMRSDCVSHAYQWSPVLLGQRSFTEPFFLNEWILAAVIMGIIFLFITPVFLWIPRLENLPPNVIETPLLRPYGEQQLDEQGREVVAQMRDGGLGEKTNSRLDELLPDETEEQFKKYEHKKNVHPESDEAIPIEITISETTPEEEVVVEEVTDELPPEDVTPDELDKLEDPEELSTTRTVKQPLWGIRWWYWLVLAVVFVLFVLWVYKMVRERDKRRWTQTATQKPHLFLKSVYNSMLMILASVGLRGTPSMTPGDYETFVAQHDPALYPGMGALTELFHRARYSQQVLDHQDSQIGYTSYEEMIDYLQKSGNINLFQRIIISRRRIMISR